MFVHLPGLEDEWPGVYDDDRYFEKGRGFNRGGQGRIRLRKVKRFAVNCVLYAGCSQAGDSANRISSRLPGSLSVVLVLQAKHA